jgi:hypothetical protein
MIAATKNILSILQYIFRIQTGKKRINFILKSLYRPILKYHHLICLLVDQLH